MSDVTNELRSYRTVLDERAPEVTLTETTTPAATPIRAKRSPWPVFATSLAVVLVAALVILLNQEGESTPVDTVVPTTVVDATPTTVPTPTTIPVAPASTMGEQLTTVGDDDIVVAMAQGFPLTDPEFSWAGEPDEASGQTAGISTSGDLDGPEDAENLGEFSVEFMAFETEELASEYLEARQEFLRVLDLRPLTGLGDEASAMAVEGDWNYITEHGHALVRRGRFVAETIVILDGDGDIESGPEDWIAKAAEFAEITDATMQTLLSSDIQPLPAPPPETLTSYQMDVMVYRDPQPGEVFSIVTPEGYGCMLYADDEVQPGVAEIGDDAFEQVDWDQGWFPSTTDSPEFQSLKDFCQTWSPHLEESYLGDLIKLQEGHIGINNGRQTLSYWFTKDDLIEAGVVTASDNIEINEFRVIVDQAGPWLVSLRVGLEGDTKAVRRLVRLDFPNLETAYLFSIDVAPDITYSFIDDDSETWADHLDAWIQPRR